MAWTNGIYSTGIQSALAPFRHCYLLGILVPVNGVTFERNLEKKMFILSAVCLMHGMVEEDVLRVWHDYTKMKFGI